VLGDHLVEVALPVGEDLDEGRDVDRLLAFVHDPGGHGGEATDLTSHRESRDATQVDGFQHREQPDHCW